MDALTKLLKKISREIVEDQINKIFLLSLIGRENPINSLDSS